MVGREDMRPRCRGPRQIDPIGRSHRTRSPILEELPPVWGLSDGNMTVSLSIARYFQWTPQRLVATASETLGHIGPHAMARQNG